MLRADTEEQSTPAALQRNGWVECAPRAYTYSKPVNVTRADVYLMAGGHVIDKVQGAPGKILMRDGKNSPDFSHPVQVRATGAGLQQV